MTAPAPLATRRALDWPTVGLVGVVIAGVLAALWIVLTRTPPETIEKLLELNWGAVVIGATSLVLAVVGMLRRAGLWKDAPAPTPDLAKPWDEPGYHDEDPTPAMSPRAIERRDRAPGDSTRPRSRRDGSASPTVLAGVLTLVLVAIAALASGCGASAVRVHATSATIATQAASAMRAELVRARDAAIAECGARAVDQRLACLDEARELHTAAAAAFDVAVLAIADYRELTEVAHLAHDQDVAGVVLARAKSHAVEQWGRAMELARALGARVPSGELALAPPGGEQ